MFSNLARLLEILNSFRKNILLWRFRRILPVEMNLNETMFIAIFICFIFSGGTTIKCASGYEGPLCSTCIKGFASMGKKSCSECSSPELNFFLIILGILGLCTFLMIMTL